jgi:CAAX prenyl protease-like protein
MALHISRSAQVRVLPFVAFMLLLLLRGSVPPENAWGVDPRWIYGATVMLVGGLLFTWRHEYGELARQTLPDVREALWAVGVGLVIFVLWIHLDAPWMTLGEATASFRPLTGDGAVDWPLAGVRWFGATVVVPVMEELFWRSFLMRWAQRPNFAAVDPRSVGPRAVLVSTFVFVLAHPLWLAAAIAGLAYAWLYMRSGKLWMSVIAHAITNGALGAWVVTSRQWQFW